MLSCFFYFYFLYLWEQIINILPCFPSWSTKHALDFVYSHSTHDDMAWGGYYRALSEAFTSGAWVHREPSNECRLLVSMIMLTCKCLFNDSCTKRDWFHEIYTGMFFFLSDLDLLVARWFKFVSVCVGRLALSTRRTLRKRNPSSLLHICSFTHNPPSHTHRSSEYKKSVSQFSHSPCILSGRLPV